MDARCDYCGGTDGGGINDVFGGVLGSGGGDTYTWQSKRTLVASEVVVSSL